jgi:hypothetical protein
MLDEDALVLQSNLLRFPGKWTPKREGLTFLLPNGGEGK